MKETIESLPGGGVLVKREAAGRAMSLILGQHDIDGITPWPRQNMLDHCGVSLEEFEAFLDDLESQGIIRRMRLSGNRRSRFQMLSDGCDEQPGSKKSRRERRQSAVVQIRHYRRGSEMEAARGNHF